MPEPVDSSNMLPLVRLVRDRVAASGLSLRDFAEQRGVSYSTLRRYHDPNLAPTKQPPRPSVLQDLVNALDVPRSVVEQAADASVQRSYRTTTQEEKTDGPPIAPSSVLDAIRADPHLPPEARAQLLAHYELMLRAAQPVLPMTAERAHWREQAERTVETKRAPPQPATPTSP